MFDSWQFGQLEDGSSRVAILGEVHLEGTVWDRDSRPLGGRGSRGRGHFRLWLLGSGGRRHRRGLLRYSSIRVYCQPADRQGAGRYTWAICKGTVILDAYMYVLEMCEQLGLLTL